MPAGRPRKIQSVEQFEELAENYIKTTHESGEPLTLLGLVLALGLSSRESLDEYGRRPEFSDSVKRAKAFVELEYEKRLFGNNATGPIFALKNFGWKDRSETEISGPDGGAIKNEWTIKVVE